MNKHQKGTTALEFAIVAAMFLTVVLAILDFGRILYTWNAVGEATRWGARQAVVCSIGSGTVLARMQRILPSLQATNVTVQWYDASGTVSTTCDATNCAGVSVSVAGLTVSPVSPAAWMGFSSIAVPGFSTYLPREIMGQDANSSTSGGPCT
ncbi:TadE/TadG family type IV pilus assembly protein [Ralstonia soli]|uniref:Pilus assembly protein n=1 Tax=Ralstonia soli TaxID=2953896 RepID=A0ABT1AJI8_9RALS|nr:TadE/TadG family type IV pilus assembly protein [Ralstonia soli]MCO5398543.1 pilus assembly protein [Ralstonia soli]